MKKVDFVLTSLLGAMAVASCTSTSSAPVVACGPDNVATTNADVVAAVNAEAASYYASLDPIVFGGPSWPMRLSVQTPRPRTRHRRMPWRQATQGVRRTQG